MTNAFRNVSFCAAVVNLCFWLTLIASPRRNSQILLITGGLGVQMTGAAIGQSLRQLSPYTVLAGGLVAILSHFLCLFIWWHALRPRGQTANPEPLPLLEDTYEDTDASTPLSLPSRAL